MRTRRYAGGGDTQSKIDKLQKLIDNPDVSENDKKNYRDALKQFKEKLASEKKTTEKPKVADKKQQRNLWLKNLWLKNLWLKNLWLKNL